MNTPLTSRFIVVANRLPVSVSKKNGKLEFSASSGGLATAMSSLKDQVGDMLWIGWPGISSDQLTTADKRQITLTLKEYNCIPVFLTADQVHNFYEGFANDTLWPLFHYFKSKAQYADEYWRAYQEASEIYERIVVRHAAPDATIWIHDYHFLLLPAALRNRLPQSKIGFFLHIPFPSFEIFRLLPNRREVLEGMLGADLVGFHIYDYAQHFINSVRRVLGYEGDHGNIFVPGRTIQADAFPIGIDYDKFVASLEQQDVVAELAQLDERYKGQKIIISVDRLDYSKGIEQRLHAYDAFLKKYPNWHRKVTLVMVAVPSRTEVVSYRELRDEIEQTVSRINGTYGTLEWAPISYQFQNLPFAYLVALYARADVALVTPLRDGMNLVAKEYVACKEWRPGVLILSEMAGAADEMLESLQVNPNDNKAIVSALRRALTMPKKEQRQRLLGMQNRLKSYTVQHWASDFVTQLSAASKLHSIHGGKILDGKREGELVKAFRSATHRLLLLDYDGTIQPFTTTPLPDQAAPSPALVKLLNGIATLPNTDVAIISGRNRTALDSWFKKTKLTLIAEHGVWIKYGGEWYQRDAVFHDHKQSIIKIMKHYAERTPGSFVEEKDFAVVWHYRMAPPELAYARSASLKHELRNALAHSGIGVFAGSKIVEVKPENITKGTAAAEILANQPYDFILCAGDDYTDEDMFTAVPEESYTIKVGPGATHARYQIESVSNVHRLLRRLK